MRVRFIDNEVLLQQNQLIDFSRILENVLKMPKYEDSFKVVLNEKENTMEVTINSTTVLFDNRTVSLTDEDDFDEIISTKLVDDIDDEDRILIVDFGLNKNVNVDKSFYLKLKNLCDIELIVTSWADYRRDVIDELMKAGCYFIERAASEETHMTTMNWRASSNIKYNYEYSNEIDKLKDNTIKELCKLFVDRDNVNLRYLGTILFLIGKNIDDKT